MNKRIVLAVIILTIFSFAQRVDSIVRVGACETPGYADGVYIQGQYAYIADRSGVTSIDINVPEAPIFLDYLNEPRCQATGMFVFDTLAYINSALAGPAFTIVNIANPSAMVRISAILVPDGGVNCKGIMIVDTLAFFADGFAGFLIINAADLQSPIILCSLDTPGELYDLYIRDTFAFLADRDSLLIINVSEPNNPIIIGHIGIPGSGAYDVWVTGNYAFITEEDFFGGQGKVNMIDVSDPTAPSLVKQVSMAATPYGLFVVNDKVYVAADDWWLPAKQKEGRADIEGGIRVVHWAQPDTMDLLVSFDTPGRCRDIFVVDSFIYVTVVDSFMIYKYINTGITEQKKKSLGAIGSFLVYPNPFSSQTKISFVIPTRSFVSVEIHDVSGRRVRDLAGGYFIPGQYQVIWNGKDNSGLEVPVGVYYVRLSTKSGMIRSEKETKIIFVE